MRLGVLRFEGVGILRIYQNRRCKRLSEVVQRHAAEYLIAVEYRGPCAGIWIGPFAIIGLVSASQAM
jgi:hypothetical protein